MNCGLRLIGTDCQKCLLFKQILTEAQMPFIYYDGDDPSHEKEQDDWGITEYPVLQIINKETNQVVYSFLPGLVGVKTIKIKIGLLEKKV